jgi:hypothetical protein
VMFNKQLFGFSAVIVGIAAGVAWAFLGRR